MKQQFKANNHRIAGPVVICGDFDFDFDLIYRG
jgi:hypothetical protein